MNRTLKISAVLIALSLLVTTASTAEAARASKPKEIVVVGSKLMETHADHFVQTARHAVAVWQPRIESLLRAGREDLAEAAYTRVSERLRHKSRAATGHVHRVMLHSLKQLAKHGGDQRHVLAIQSAAATAKRRILDAERRAIAILADSLGR